MRAQNFHTDSNIGSDIHISLIIVSYNTRDMLRQSLESIWTHKGNKRCEVFVVDNASMDGSANMVEKEFTWVQLICSSKNLGFAAGNNLAMHKSRGRYVVLLNPDARLTEGALEKSFEHMETCSEIGILGGQMIRPDGKLEPSARMLPSLFNKVLHLTGLSSRFPKSRICGRVDYSWWDHSEPRSVGWVVGAFFMIRRETLEQIGLLDERYFLYFEEIDFCRRAKQAGWDVVFFPYARVVHWGGQSSLQSQGKISMQGKQLINIRIKSEYRYHRKFEGIVSVALMAGFEMLWYGLIFLKNRMASSPDALQKRKDARWHISMILQTLVLDRLGAGGR